MIQHRKGVLGLSVLLIVVLFVVSSFAYVALSEEKENGEGDELVVYPLGSLIGAIADNQIIQPILRSSGSFSNSGSGGGSSSSSGGSTGSNNPPTADAGVPQTVNEGDPVTLDAVLSSDPDLSDTLAYSWAQTNGTATVTLINPNSRDPTFTAPSVGPAGDILTFQVIVNDGNGATDSATVDITVDNVNIVPTANAGPDQTVDEGTIDVTLDASGSSDPDLSDTLTYSWVQMPGTTTVTLSDPAVAQPTFTAPFLAATEMVTFEVTVNDGNGATDSATVVITITDLGGNNPPTASAGPDQTVNEGDTVTLLGSGSDPDLSDTLTYSWVQMPGTTTVTLSDPAVAQPTFTAPSVGPAGEMLTFELTVDDMNGGSDTALVTITIDNVNIVPTANAGPDQTVNEGDTVTLLGSGSDPDLSDTLTYSWVQTNGTTVTLSDPAVAQPTFTAPAATQTVLTFEVTVDDSNGGVVTDTVDITVNNAPTWGTLENKDAGTDPSDGQVVYYNLEGEAQDADGDTLTFSIVSTHPYYDLFFDGQDLKIRNYQKEGYGTETVTVQADDGNGRIAQSTFQLTVHSEYCGSYGCIIDP